MTDIRSIFPVGRTFIFKMSNGEAFRGMVVHNFGEFFEVKSPEHNCPVKVNPDQVCTWTEAEPLSEEEIAEIDGSFQK